MENIMEKLQKKKQLNLENVHTYMSSTDCGVCGFCAVCPLGGEVVLVALVTLAS